MTEQVVEEKARLTQAQFAELEALKQEQLALRETLAKEIEEKRLLSLVHNDKFVSLLLSTPPTKNLSSFFSLRTHIRTHTAHSTITNIML